MREIKFRAWDKEEREMFNVGAIAWSHNAFDNRSYLFGTNPHCYEDKCKSIAHLNEDCVFMQYIDLKDKNGIEICEGDIIKCFNLIEKDNDFIAIIKFSDVDLKFGLYSNYHLYDFNNIRYEYEIIGNIYENPELLEEC